MGFDLIIASRRGLGIDACISSGITSGSSCGCSSSNSSNIAVVI